MGEIHIYTVPGQPATQFTDYNLDPPLHSGFAPNKLLWADCCGKRHRASSLVVQCYYDCLRVWCAPGKGCKDPRVIAAEERRRFRNRSRGQKRRWLNSAIAKATADGERGEA